MDTVGRRVSFIRYRIDSTSVSRINNGSVKCDFAFGAPSLAFSEKEAHRCPTARISDVQEVFVEASEALR